VSAPATTTTTTTATTTGAGGRRVVIVGSGPAGLSAATQLRRASRSGRELEVVVLEREQHPGGIPRHTDHLGYGMRDLHRVVRGPRYAELLVRRTVEAGVDLRTCVTVIGVDGGGVDLADGSRLDAHAVVLATGVRERPRSARLVPGDRPAGVLTTGALQQLTALQHRRVGNRAVVVGAEHVSFSAILSLRHGGCETVALVTPHARHQTYAPLRLLTATRHRVPVLTGVDVAQIIGHRRVEAVELTDGRRLECDTVVFTGDWIPDHELARRAGLVMDRGARSPAVDARLHTSVPGLFAAGNLVHPAETADICALDGRRVAASVLAHLDGAAWPGAVAPVTCDPPIRWVAPSAAGTTLRVDSPTTGRIVVLVDGSPIWTGRRRRLLPNRAVHLPLDLPPTAHVTLLP
jgi:thioredoxin reductase